MYQLRMVCCPVSMIVPSAYWTVNWQMKKYVAFEPNDSNDFQVTATKFCKKKCICFISDLMDLISDVSLTNTENKMLTFF